MTGSWTEPGHMVPERAPSLDAAIAELAERQYGVVSVSQLGELGLSPSGVRKRVGRARLHRVHRGVFAVGRPGLGTEGAYMAAALAVRGPIALDSAAHHRDLLPSPCTNPVHVAVPGRRRGRPGIAVHTGPRDWTEHEGIPTTTIDQTLIDLAAGGRRRLAERALTRAETVLRHDFGPLIEHVRGPIRGCTLLRELLAAPPDRTRNELEAAMRDLCSEYRHPQPEINQWIPFPEGGGAEADFLWRRERVIIETDSLTFHRTQKAMDHDYGRDARLELLGWRVRRVSWRQVFEQPGLVGTLIGHLLASAPDEPERTGAGRAAA